MTDNLRGIPQRPPLNYEQAIYATCPNCGTEYSGYHGHWIADRPVTREIAERLLCATRPLPAGELIGRIRTCRDELSPAYIGDDAYKPGCENCGNTDGEAFLLSPGPIYPVLIEGNFLRLLLMLHGETIQPPPEALAAAPLRMAYERVRHVRQEVRELRPIWVGSPSEYFRDRDEDWLSEVRPCPNL